MRQPREAGIYAVWMRLSTGKLKVFRSCKNWFDEFRIFCRDENGNIINENKFQLMASTRYLFLGSMKRWIVKPVPKAAPRPPELYSSDSRNGEFMAIPSIAGKAGTIVVSALRARTNFGKLLRRIDDERGSLVIEKRGIPRAVLLSIRDYVKLAAPEPEVLRVLGEESERNRTSASNSREIDKLIRKVRSQKSMR